MAKTQDSAPVNPGSKLSVSEYCSSRGLTRLDTLVLKQALSSDDRFSRKTVAEWDAKRAEFYSRKS